jgi:hypothetical protein
MNTFAQIANEELAGDIQDIPQRDLSCIDFTEDGTDSIELLEYLNGIECGLEAIQATHGLLDVLARCKPEDKHSARMAAISFESIRRSTYNSGYFDMVAVEAFNENGIALEGVKTFIQSVWDAIVRTFKTLWDRLMSLFKTAKVDKTVEIVEKTVHNVDQEIKERIKAVKHIEPEAAPVNTSTTEPKEVKHEPIGFQSIAHHFSYMGKDITLNDLLLELQKIKKTIDAVGSIALSVERANMNMQEAVKQFSRSGIRGNGSSYASRAINNYYESVTRGFIKGGDLQPYREELMQKLSVPYNRVDREYTYHLDGFTRGVKIFAFMSRSSGAERLEDSTFKFLITKDTINEAVGDSIRIKDLEHVSVYGHEVLRALTGYQHFNKELSDISGHIVRMQQGLLNDISVYARLAEGSERETVERFQYYREVTRALVAMGLDLIRFDATCFNTVSDHSKLLQYIYPKVVNSVQD